MKRLIFGLLLLFFCCSVLEAKKYYVAKSGDDGNTGTLEAPFKTISKAAGIMVAGDTCLIKEGVYRETVNPANSGQSGNPIVFKAFESDSVVVNATNVIDNWTTHSGDILKASYTMSLGVERNMLFFDNKFLDIARWPDNADDDRFSFDGYEVESGSRSHIVSNGIPTIDWTGGYICYLGAHSGMTWTREITGSSSGRIDFTAVDINKWPFNPHNPTVYRNENYGRFYLFGKLEALDHPGEWFYDDSENVVYMMAPEGTDPADAVIEATSREFTFNITKDYVVVEGITAYGGVVQLSGDNCTVKDCVVSHALESLDELDNTDAQIGNGAINVWGSNTLIERNLIEYGTGNGIAFLASWRGSSNHIVRNNVIRYFNSIGVHANPVRSNCTGTTVEKNTIYTCGRDGIYNSGANGVIAYNDVYDCMKINNDGGVLYTVGNDNLKNSIIHHNWFHDSYGPDYADGRAAGIYLDNDSKGYDVHHNVVWNITWSGVQINWENHDLLIANNTFWNVGEAMGRWANGFGMQNVEVYNNFSEVAEWIGTDIDDNLINTTDLFVDAANGDFRLKSDAFVIDLGREISGITDGFSGSAPDLGAYEAGGEAWEAGADWAPQGETDPDNRLFDLKIEVYALNVYPNPTKGDIYISVPEPLGSDLSVSVFTFDGRQVYFKVIEASQLMLGNAVKINSGQLPAGTYLVRGVSGGKVFSARVFVR